MMTSSVREFIVFLKTYILYGEARVHQTIRDSFEGRIYKDIRNFIKITVGEMKYIAELLSGEIDVTRLIQSYILAASALDYFDVHSDVGFAFLRAFQDEIGLSF